MNALYDIEVAEVRELLSKKSFTTSEICGHVLSWTSSKCSTFFPGCFWHKYINILARTTLHYFPVIVMLVNEAHMIVNDNYHFFDVYFLGVLIFVSWRRKCFPQAALLFSDRVKGKSPKTRLRLQYCGENDAQRIDETLETPKYVITAAQPYERLRIYGSAVQPFHLLRRMWLMHMGGVGTRAQWTDFNHKNSNISDILFLYNTINKIMREIKKVCFKNVCIYLVSVKRDTACPL